MGMPSKVQINKALKKLRKVEGTLAPPADPSADPSALEKFRFDIQQKFVAYKMKMKLSQREMAKSLEIDEGKMSKILHNRINEFSTDRLISLYEIINPEVKLKVS